MPVTLAMLMSLVLLPAMDAMAVTVAKAKVNESQLPRCMELPRLERMTFCAVAAITLTAWETYAGRTAA